MRHYIRNHVNIRWILYIYERYVILIIHVIYYFISAIYNKVFIKIKQLRYINILYLIMPLTASVQRNPVL